MERNEARALRTFRPPPARRRVDDLLNPDVLDDDTRRMLLDEVMRPAQPAPPPQQPVTPTRTTASQPPLPAPRRVSNSSVASKPAAAAVTTTTRAHDEHTQQHQSRRHGSNNENSDTAAVSSFAHHLRERVHGSSSGGSGGNNVSGDKAADDVVTAMAARLAAVERLHVAYQSELRELHAKYRALQDKYDGECRQHAAATCALQALARERDALQCALAQQHEGVATANVTHKDNNNNNDDDDDDGDSSVDDNNHHGVDADDDATGTRCPVDVALLTRNARVLSEHVGRTCIRAAGKHGGLHDRDVVRVVVYRNGIRVNDGPFRPYGWPLCDAFVLDLAEGYYPYEFKQRYPDGVPLDVLDRSDVDCAVGAPSQAHAARRPCTRSHSRDGGGGGDAALSLAQLLARVPAQRVTASGQLVAVRAGVAAFAGVAPPSSQHDNTDNGRDKAVRHHLTAVEQRCAGDAHACAALLSVLVRLPSGEQVLLRTTPEHTVAELRRELQLAAPALASLRYELAEAAPLLRCLRVHTQTLREAAVTRNVALLVHRLPAT